MKVRFNDIPEEGLHYTLPLEKDWLNSIAPEGVRFPRDMASDVTIDTAGRDVLVNGTIEGSMELTCVRCLAPYPYRLDARFSVMLSPDDRGRGGRDEGLSKEELDTDVYRDGIVDLEGTMLDQIILSLPEYPHCREECRGLCPSCGKNRNTAPCSCAGAAAGSAGTGGGAFSSLKNIRIAETTRKETDHAESKTQALKTKKKKKTDTR